MVKNDKDGAVCPGCGQSLKKQQITLSARYNAADECYQQYSELSSYTIGKQDIHFIHQHAIDTYTAQHSGKTVKNISTAFSLIGLYYAVEHGFSGKQVQRVHSILSHRKYHWPELRSPVKSSYRITVVDVMNEQTGRNRDEILYEWMNDVWTCWGYMHNWVKQTCDQLLK